MSQDAPEREPLGFSRRDFLKGSGSAAVGTALLNSGIAAAEEATKKGPVTYGPEEQLISLTVNGKNVKVRVDPATTLVEVIRNELQLTGTKIGCDRGACSACTVWLNDEVAASCMTFALDARGKKVTTIEGLAKGDELHPIQLSFMEHDAMQCGFCTPGMVMSCAALVNRTPHCSLEEVKTAVSGHLCRCGTYPNIFKATLAVAEKGAAPKVSQP